MHIQNVKLSCTWCMSWCIYSIHDACACMWCVYMCMYSCLHSELTHVFTCVCIHAYIQSSFLSAFISTSRAQLYTHQHATLINDAFNNCDSLNSRHVNWSALDSSLQRHSELSSWVMSSWIHELIHTMNVEVMNLNVMNWGDEVECHPASQLYIHCRPDCWGTHTHTHTHTYTHTYALHPASEVYIHCRPDCW